MEQLQSQAWLDPCAGLVRPTAEQVPGAQTQVLGDQQPQPQEGTTDLVRQELADAAFEAGGIDRSEGGVCPSALDEQRWFRGRLAAVEFFFCKP